MVSLTGAATKSEDHSTAPRELDRVLRQRAGADGVTRALRELIAAKADVEYGSDLVTRTKASVLVRRARTVVEAAAQIVRLGR